MAEVVSKFNTKDKTLTVALDGKEVSNIHEVVMFKSYDGKDFTMSLATCVRDDAEGIMRMERIVASESIEGKKAIASGEATPTKHDEFVRISSGLKTIQDEINEFSKKLLKRSR